MNFDNQNWLFAEIAIGASAVLIYVIGVYLHTKKVKICWKEGEVAGKLEITNSIISIIHWFFVITIYGITHVVKDLHGYTGKWFCYSSKIILSIGDAHIMGHSFFIAFLKFMVINYAGPDNTRKEKFKKICFVLNLLYGVIVVGILNMVRPDYIFVYHSSMADRCFGRSGTIKSNDNTSSAANLVQLCNIPGPAPDFSFDYVIHEIRNAVCWVDVTFIYLNGANVLEAICYCRTFMVMHRYGIITKLGSILN